LQKKSCAAWSVSAKSQLREAMKHMIDFGSAVNIKIGNTEAGKELRISPPTICSTIYTPIRISVVTATWNCVSTLPDCLRSVARQSYANIEHLVVDGGSTDGTINVINDNIGNISRFKSERDGGIYDALNKGIQLATGDVIGFLHADDLFATDDVLAKIGEIFGDPSICAVYGDLDYVSNRDTSKVIRRWRSKPFLPGYLSWGWMPPHPTLYVRKNWYSRVGGFDVNYHISADYLFILKLFSQSDFKSVHVPDVLVKMRLGGASNKSLKALLIKTREDWRALRSCNFLVFFAFRAIVWKNTSKVAQFFLK